MQLLFLIYLISKSSSKVIAEYRLWKNYGQIIYDYSGNNYQAVNGETLDESSDDILFTDRGAYFQTSSILKLPPNLLSSSAISFPAEYSILIWVNTQNIEGKLLVRNNRQQDHLFLKRALNGNQAHIYIKISNTELYDTNCLSSFWISSKAYLDQWILISVGISPTSITFRINTDNIVAFNIDKPYISQDTSFSVGFKSGSSSLPGFIWLVSIFTSPISFSDFIQNSQSSNCFIGQCSCSPAMVIQDLGTFCVSVSLSITQDSLSNPCRGSFSCSKNIQLQCNCPSQSCLLDKSSGCACLNTTTGSNYTASCNCASGGQGCCNTQCSSCVDETSCLTCKDPSKLLNSTGLCSCNQGYFDDASVSTCSPCLSKCKTCSDLYSCTSCSDRNSHLSNGDCLCNNGYFNSAEDSFVVCSPCLSKCGTCLNSTQCTSCLDVNYLKVNDDCSCKNSFYLQEGGVQCLPCLNECKTCVNGNSCLDCNDLNGILDTNNRCVCKGGYYLQNSSTTSTCLQCKSDCLKCSKDFCYYCTDPYKTPNSEGVCVCNKGFTDEGGTCVCPKGFRVVDKTCEDFYFFGSIYVSPDNKVILNFTQPSELSSDDITVQTNTDVLTSLVTQLSESRFLITFKYAKSIDAGVIVNVVISNTTYSSFGAKLKDYFYLCTLYKYDYFNEQLSQVNTKSKVISQTVSSSVIGVAIFTNPYFAWALINTLQFLNYVPFSYDRLSPTVVQFLSGIGGFNFIPNIISFFFSSNSSSAPDDNALNGGINSSVLLINTGNTVMVLVFIVILYPFFLLIGTYTEGDIKEYIEEIKLNYTYGFFLRFWIQSFLDFIFYSVLQVINVRTMQKPQDNYFQYFFNVFLAIGVIVIFNQTLTCVTIPALLYFNYCYFEEFKNESKSDFKKKYGSLFEEFKHDKGVVGSSYYVLYFVRRVMFMICQMFLEGLAQKTLNLFFSLLSLAFLVYYRPFKEGTVQVSNLFTEITVFIVLVLVTVLKINDSSDVEFTVEYIVVYSVLSCLVIQSLISYFSFFVLLIKKIKKTMKILAEMKENVDN